MEDYFRMLDDEVKEKEREEEVILINFYREWQFNFFWGIQEKRKASKKKKKKSKKERDEEEEREENQEDSENNEKKENPEF